jgi:hypothetical protein
MKTKFTNCVRSFSGRLKSQGLVHCKYNQGNLVITRKYPVVEIIEHHHTFGNRGKNLAALFKTLSPEYVSDLKNYAALFSKTVNINEKLPPSYYSLYLRMMWKLKHLYPEIDMATITRDDILQHEYPIRSVLESMESEMLLQIEEASMLNHEI